MCECLFMLNKREELIDNYNKAIKYAESEIEIFICNIILGKYYFESVYIFIIIMKIEWIWRGKEIFEWSKQIYNDYNRRRRSKRI